MHFHANDLPVGQSHTNPVKPAREKYSSFVFQKIMIIVTVSRLDKRDVRVVTNVGRDAMDAGCARDEARGFADGEGVQAWRPSGRCQVLR